MQIQVHFIKFIGVNLHLLFQRFYSEYSKFFWTRMDMSLDWYNWNDLFWLNYCISSQDGCCEKGQHEENIELCRGKTNLSI